MVDISEEEVSQLAKLEANGRQVSLQHSLSANITGLADHADQNNRQQCSNDC